jgi:hypothetical protein
MLLRETPWETFLTCETPDKVSIQRRNLALTPATFILTCAVAVWIGWGIAGGSIILHWNPWMVLSDSAVHMKTQFPGRIHFARVSRSIHRIQGSAVLLSQGQYQNDFEKVPSF